MLVDQSRNKIAVHVHITAYFHYTSACFHLFYIPANAILFFLLIGGVDYVPISVSQNITGGSTECITIDIINDATPENEEHFFVVLNVSVQVGQNITLARVNILDNDSCKDYKKIPQHLCFFGVFESANVLSLQ